MSTPAPAEDGYKLWLRHEPLPAAQAEAWRAQLGSLVIKGPATASLALKELQAGLTRLLGSPLPVATDWDGSVLNERAWESDEAFFIHSTKSSGKAATLLEAKGSAGLIYGAFELLRRVERGAATHLEVIQGPRFKRRLLNHWDNLDGSIERGYAGKSLWNWEQLPSVVDPRLIDYARACASIGLNGTVLNNVNTNPAILKPDYLKKVAAIADTLRPWGLRVYLSVNFGSPKALGDLKTADPLDPEVIQWWKVKTDEVYALIPDLGGFLVKANSEGQPGPQDYGRHHGDGANMLAKVLKTHGGVVIWRAFVYNPDVDPDRIKRAYLEFKPLDGKLEDNAFVQVKHGPHDFQPREPYSPLFGAVPRTKLSAELQIAQEYFGHSTHLVYLAPVWKEFLDSETFVQGPGSTVARVVDGSLDKHADSMIAAVANTGSDQNWCGHDFAQANWYAYGRLAWDPDLTAEAIAREWAAQTWTREPAALHAISGLMLGSHPAFVDYAAPLGLGGHFEKDLHYAPDPGMVDERRDDWSATYFVRADKAGLGFDRSRQGSGAVDQYPKALADRFNNLSTCPEDLLLFFHHVPWDKKLASGRTLWDELGWRYARGVERAQDLLRQWQALEGKVDEARWGAILAKLKQQARDAATWKALSLKYFDGIKER